MTLKMLEKMGSNIGGEEFQRVKIVAIGVGGGGCNTITRLYEMGITTAELVAVNTDEQALKEHTKAHYKIPIGDRITRGRGAGGDPDLAYKAALEDASKLDDIVKDAELVFITCGQGGGTGTGASPVIAKHVRKVIEEHGIVREPLIVSVCTLPFTFEGPGKMKKAIAGIKALQKYSDSVIVISNNKLLELAPHLPFQQAFKIADQVIADMIYGISDTVNKVSLLNIDFNDVKAVFQRGPLALIGLGRAEGSQTKGMFPQDSKENVVAKAVLEALKKKMIDFEFTGGKAALVHFTVGPEVSLSQIDEAMKIIIDKMEHDDYEVKIGARTDETLKNEAEAMVIITGVRIPLLEEISKTQVSVDYTFFKELTRERKLSAEFIDEEIEEDEEVKKIVEGLELL